MSSKPVYLEEKEDDNLEELDEHYNPEEETFVDWGKEEERKLKPLTNWKTGEEDEDIIATYQVKLYRWANDEWKQRGRGCLKFLQHKDNKQIRIVMRQDQTKKVVANFYIFGEGCCKLERRLDKERAWEWTCKDCSDGSYKIEKLSCKFEKKEEFEEFQKEFEKAREFNLKIYEEYLKSQEEKKEKVEDQVKKEPGKELPNSSKEE